ncbi:hypothetical protein B808_521 [Fructilactobacillus florum 8D]|uniref:DUF1906 domain-containing protein n=2 Tax=Fructilactobacillus florum TaxID=640331 RepID=W9EER5_9LACO|nr:glycoside hydrolase domain-containing protein [Fructilactobacillus florum]ETO40572.1 hypothetical protein B808_521 [Fructilactobacillus florum 8D]
MDQQVLKVQKWLNSEYGKVSGFTKIKENGQTGWNTIYGLREGLQHELGINPVASGFGAQTKNAVGSKVAGFVVGYKGNIAKLIQGAFWCKGYNPGSFNTTFSKDTQAAVDSLRKDAGLSIGNLTVSLMAALFDMSAFKLLDGGTNSVRQMQQYLNRNYLAYFGDDLGLVPTDGLYQRNTNTALIYALQVSIGLADKANGVYGPTTINYTPTVYQDEAGPTVKIIQYGLMVNGFYDGAVDGVYSASVASAVLSFREFMKLAPYNGSADLEVIKGLLTSNGDTNRDSDACDTSFQVSSATAKKLKNFGFNLIGRYLTGTVGVGSNRRRKNLTSSEIENLVNAGLSIFPIYQDNDGSEEYFTANQGVYDANVAANAAQRLGFPKGTTIYFAVDTDVQDGDIAGTVIPYMASVKNHLRNGYKVGIYGTRNVCNRTLKEGYAVNAFVSDMSTGYSGNLGYKMPKKWSLDQFTEFNFADIAVDQDASSGRDTGTSKFNPISPVTVDPLQALRYITDNTKLELDVPLTTVNITDSVKMVLNASASLQELDGDGIFTITNGSVPSVDVTKWLENKYDVKGSVADVIAEGFNKFTVSKDINEGQMSVSVNNDADGYISISLSINIYQIEIDNKNWNTEANLSISLKIKPSNLPLIKQEIELLNFVEQNSKKVVIGLAVLIGTISGIGLVVVTSPGDAAAAIGTAIIALFVSIKNAIQSA